jgi:hypothetical protein
MTQSATPDLNVCITAGGLALYFRLHFSYQSYLALKLPDHVTEFHHFSWFHLNMWWQPEPLCNKPLVVHEEMSVPWSHMRSRLVIGTFVFRVSGNCPEEKGWGGGRTCKLHSSWTPTNHIFICHFVGPHLTQAQDNALKAQDNATSRIGGLPPSWLILGILFLETKNPVFFLSFQTAFLVKGSTILEDVPCICRP